MTLIRRALLALALMTAPGLAGSALAAASCGTSYVEPNASPYVASSGSDGAFISPKSLGSGTILNVTLPSPASVPVGWAICLTAEANKVTQAVAPSLAAPAAPTLSSVSGGTLSAATYYVKITYLNSAGETLASSESSIAVAGNNLPKVTSPGASGNAVSYNVYISTGAGAETKQNLTPIAIGTDWTLPTSGLIAGAALPTSATATSAYILAGNNKALGSLKLGPDNYTTAGIFSDGSNFRVMYASPETLQAAGARNGYPSRWIFPPGPGYTATTGDNGEVISSGAATGGLALTLPSTTGLQSGYTIAIAADAGNGLTVTANGGSIVAPGISAASYTMPTSSGQMALLQYDGANWRLEALNGPNYGGTVSFLSCGGKADNGVTDNKAAFASCAANMIAAGGGGTLKFDAQLGCYQASELILPDTAPNGSVPEKRLTLKGDGHASCVQSKSHSDKDLLKSAGFYQKVHAHTTIQANPGDYQITVDDPTMWHVGDTVTAGISFTFSGGTTTTGISAWQIAAISGNTLTFSGDTDCTHVPPTYPAGNRCLPAGLTIPANAPLWNASYIGSLITLEDLYLDGNGANQDTPGNVAAAQSIGGASDMVLNNPGGDGYVRWTPWSHERVMFWSTADESARTITVYGSEVWLDGTVHAITESLSGPKNGYTGTKRPFVAVNRIAWSAASAGTVSASVADGDIGNVVSIYGSYILDRRVTIQNSIGRCARFEMVPGGGYASAFAISEHRSYDLNCMFAYGGGVLQSGRADSIMYRPVIAYTHGYGLHGNRWASGLKVFGGHVSGGSGVASWMSKGVTGNLVENVEDIRVEGNSSEFHAMTAEEGEINVHILGSAQNTKWYGGEIFDADFDSYNLFGRNNVRTGIKVGDAGHESQLPSGLHIDSKCKNEAFACIDISTTAGGNTLRAEGNLNSPTYYAAAGRACQQSSGEACYADGPAIRGTWQRSTSGTTQSDTIWAQVVGSTNANGGLGPTVFYDLTQQPSGDCSSALTLIGSVTVGSPTFTTKYCHWERNQRQVTVRFDLAGNTSAFGGLSGNVSVGGLPLATEPSAGIGIGIMQLTTGVTYPAGETQLTGVMTANQSSMALQFAKGTLLTNTMLSGAYELKGVIQFETAN